MLSHLPDVLRPISLLDIKDDILRQQQLKEEDGGNGKSQKTKSSALKVPFRAWRDDHSVWNLEKISHIFLDGP